VTARTTRLVILLRVAYLIGAGLFLLDMVIAISAQTISFAGTGTIAEDASVEIWTDWIALAAFAFAAIGAIATVAVLSDRSVAPDDDVESEPR
jgi:hypothetical protein